MKKYGTWFAGMALMLALVSCGKDDPAPSIVGNWLRTSRNGVDIAENAAVFEVYKADGKFELQSIKGAVTDSNTYKVDGKKLTIGATDEFVYNLDVLNATSMTARGIGTRSPSTYTFRRVSDQEKAAISGRN